MLNIIDRSHALKLLDTEVQTVGNELLSELLAEPRPDFRLYTCQSNASAVVTASRYGPVLSSPLKSSGDLDSMLTDLCHEFLGRDLWYAAKDWAPDLTFNQRRVVAWTLPLVAEAPAGDTWLAKPEELDVVLSLYREFLRAQSEGTPVDALAIQAAITQGQILLYGKPELACLLKVSRLRPGILRGSALFTKPHLRRQGHSRNFLNSVGHFFTEPGAAIRFLADARSQHLNEYYSRVGCQLSEVFYCRKIARPT